jgi:type I restriction enzyme, R subunit
MCSMANFISEDNIEKALVQKLTSEYGWQAHDCYTAAREDLNDGSGRADKSEVIFYDRLRAAALKLNPDLPPSIVDTALTQLLDHRVALSLVSANQEIDGLVRDGIPVEYSNAQGRKEHGRVRVIDFVDPSCNEFLAVTQLWIKGAINWRRPDVLLYVNGIPLVMIELKNSNVKLKTAYDDNLTNYKQDIPRLFQYNAFVILSNAVETKVGSLTADWEYFFPWLRPDDERERVQRKEIIKQQVSLERAAAGLCRPDRLLDYIENFTLFYLDTQKIIAQNHQFIGVNRALGSLAQRKERRGKLGIFWHTQGAGKSFSMIFLVRKVYRKLEGSYTFVVITDREDLDSQIYKSFIRTGTVLESDAAQPQNGDQLRQYLTQNKRLVFSLIHKFHWPKGGKRYPVLSQRDDIVVIVDEAHRTQYKDLAENMRAGLPNAAYLAFTGTPLLGAKQLTHEWFGEYISEYNFTQSIEDGATVPLFYQKRVPEVQLQNDELDDELAEIYEEEHLNEAQQTRLETKFAQEAELIKRDGRLDKIAADIVEHFPTRGYLGKAMVVCVEKYIAVRMYDKVNALWKQQKNRLKGEIHKTDDPVIKLVLQKRLEFMNETQMTVVVSEEAGEEAKFQAEGLNIKPHREGMKRIDSDGRDYEDHYKDPKHPLRLVFVCAMWLTGFDVPTLSTLYLDKPMRDHTLMQAIARANRVSSYEIDGVTKKNGEIIDYYGVFRNIRKALAAYGMGEADQVDQPIQPKDNLFAMLDGAITETVAFCTERSIPIEQLLETPDTFKNVGYFQQSAEILVQKDEWRQAFNVHVNAIIGLYEACKPEILGEPRKQVAAFDYLRGVLDTLTHQGTAESAYRRVNDLLDQSIAAQVAADPPDKRYEIQGSKVWDLSQTDFAKLKEEFPQRVYPNLEIADLRGFLEMKLKQMLERNITRRPFAERLQAIIDHYNAGGSDTENVYGELIAFAEGLKSEEERHICEGLTEIELELYDLLRKDRLTGDEEIKVKNAARSLLKRLKEEQPRVLVQDWFRSDQSSVRVKNAIRDALDRDLPDSYEKPLFNEKLATTYDHIFRKASEGYFWV